MIVIDPGSPDAPYEQVRDQIIAAVRAGTLVPGTKLPTVRALAADLGLAVNTVAKAYKNLEAEGHVETRGRAGTVVLQPPDGDLLDEVGRAAQALVDVARHRGLDLEGTIGVLRHRW